MAVSVAVLTQYTNVTFSGTDTARAARQHVCLDYRAAKTRTYFESLQSRKENQRLYILGLLLTHARVKMSAADAYRKLGYRASSRCLGMFPWICQLATDAVQLISNLNAVSLVHPAAPPAVRLSHYLRALYLVSRMGMGGLPQSVLRCSATLIGFQ